MSPEENGSPLRKKNKSGLGLEEERTSSLFSVSSSGT